METSDNFSLMVHGGAGELEGTGSDKGAVRHLEGVRTVLEHGRGILRAGGSALETVEQCVSLLEDDPVFNAGAGSVLNAEGKVEMDAAIMCGASLRAGAVAGIGNIANPIQLARVLLAAGGPLLLIGAGARLFAEQNSFEFMPDSYFLTRPRLAEWQRIRDGQSVKSDQHGTVGAVARDSHGNLAAATSTGGIVGKRPGRVGDSPIVGAGLYADNETCAVSCTGIGEDFIRAVLAKTLSDLIAFKGLNGVAAADEGLNYLARKVDGRGGFILIDSHGRCAGRFNTKKMVYGWIERGGVTCCQL